LRESSFSSWVSEWDETLGKKKDEDEDSDGFRNGKNPGR